MARSSGCSSSIVGSDTESHVTPSCHVSLVSSNLTEQFRSVFHDGGTFRQTQPVILVSLGVNQSMFFFGKNITDMTPCLSSASYHIKRYMISIYLIIDDANFYHPIRTLSASFLYCKVTIRPFTTIFSIIYL